MRRIIFSGVHGIGKTTLAKELTKYINLLGYKARLYSLDNFTIYRLNTVFTSQMDRMFFGAKKLKEAEEENQEFAVFDRTLSDNILYSKCFNRFKDEKGNQYLSDDELLSVIRCYQTIEQRKNKFDALIIFLNPPFETIYNNILDRKREKDTILERKEFVECLKKMFEAHYHQYIESPLIELNTYNIDGIITKLKENDFFQDGYQ